MGVKSEMVNGTKPYQVRTKRPVKDETDLKSDAAPRMPHERDESVDSQESPIRENMKRAYDDVMEGQLDTDCRESRGVENTVPKSGAGNRDANAPCATPHPVEPSPDKPKNR